MTAAGREREAALTAADGLPALLHGLVAAALDAPARDAIITAGGGRTSFGTLVDRVGAAARGFVTAGVTPGMRTVVLTPPGPDFAVAIFGLLACGAVPVLVDPGIGVRRVRHALGAVAPRAFVGSPRALRARRLLRWAPAADRLIVTDTAGTPARGLGGVTTLAQIEAQGGVDPNPSAGWRPRTDDHEAALLFTSGSTGAPKAVVYRHAHFSAVVGALRVTYDLTPGEVNVGTFPPFALFGPVLGMTTVLPDMDFTRPAAADPEHLRSVIADHEADVLFASPALVATLVRHGRTLPSLRLVLSAGAPVPFHVAGGIAALLDKGRLATPYGMTEALPICSIGGDELRATSDMHHPPRGVCVGHPVADTDVTVVVVRSSPLATITAADELDDGHVGELVVRGPQVTEAYAGRPDATRRSKTTWAGRPAHRTGDLAWRDSEGRLWFCGRTVHRVATRDGPLDPLPIEQLVLGHADVQRAALVGVPVAGAPTTEQDPVLVVQYTEAAAPRLRRWLPGSTARRAALTAELRALLDASPHGAAVSEVLLRGRFPVDARHNAKIGYEQLARWAKARRSRRLPTWVGRRAFGGGPT